MLKACCRRFGLEALGSLRRGVFCASSRAFCPNEISSRAVLAARPLPHLAIMAAPQLTMDVLRAQDDKTSGAIIESLKDDQVFKDLAQTELNLIIHRDQEDADKLQAGVDEAIKKGVLPSDLKPPVYQQIDVLGKSADEVADVIIKKLPSDKGCVMILVGLSGTGKGTTVSKLERMLPRCTSWSNGNVFRTLTLLAVTKCEQQGIAFTPDVLTPPFLAELVKCLSFGKFGSGGAFDIKVEGYGLNLLVSQVANTTLKEPKVGKNIPTVAKMTQGEVVKFAAGAADAMRADGMNVLMEGRAQTLNYVRTPHRFELTLPDPIIIGQRRAAQRMMAKAVEKLAPVRSSVPESAVRAVLAEALKECSI